MNKKKRIIVSVTNDLYTDQRVHKVCMFLHENDFDVLLVGRKLKDSASLPERPYKTKRFKLLAEKGALFYACYNLRLFSFLLFKRAAILLSNDLDTLLANYCAKKLKPKTAIIYDTHELFTEVPELTARPKTRKVWLLIEKLIFPKLKKVYTVNESIAKIYQEKYGVKVHVVRNVSPRWSPKNIPSKKELGIPEQKDLLILQGAGINVDRGAEEAVEAMKNINDTCLLIVGSGDVIPQLKTRVKKEGIADKVLFFGKKPYNEMMYYTFHADLGLTLDKDTNANYRYSLPNKVFDYIHAGTPIIASNLVEVQRIIKKHKVGKIIPSHQPSDIEQTINDLFKEKALLEQLKLNCKKAATIECWENELTVLKEIYGL